MEVEYIFLKVVRVVKLKMDKVFFLLGILVWVSSDNGFFFNGKGFNDFCKYLLFDMSK